MSNETLKGRVREKQGGTNKEWINEHCSESAILLVIFCFAPQGSLKSLATKMCVGRCCSALHLCQKGAKTPNWHFCNLGFWRKDVTLSFLKWLLSAQSARMGFRYSGGIICFSVKTSPRHRTTLKNCFWRPSSGVHHPCKILLANSGMLIGLVA